MSLIKRRASDLDWGHGSVDDVHATYNDGIRQVRIPINAAEARATVES